MKKYATAFLSYFDNELIMDLYLADNKTDAMIKALDKNGYQYEGPYNEESVQEYAFDVDAMVNAIEVLQ